ncbi:keratin, type I cytoskeletal 9-like [Brachionichthys hirsutus]|uniref:keratin, type I cytoskeletal 9-like n=1 Tax=Brachionichthys hirsutus TaxID=412623 RepID=UPI003604DBFE
MYSSGYSQVSMRTMQPQKKMQQHRSRGKSCGYYMRIVFFFSSLIQSLIIVSLVLFLIYGKKQDSASVARIQDLEESFSRLSIENVDLKRQRKNLTSLLNGTLIEKARNDWDLAMLRYLSNRSMLIIDDFRSRLKQCSEELFSCKQISISVLLHLPPVGPGTCNCGLLLEQLNAKLIFVESNLTQTRQRMSREMDQMARERDNLNLQAISLRREKFTKEKELEFFRQKCKDDFTQSMSGISNVTKAFLQKVDSLVPACMAFQLTCPKQREHLEQIRTNCSSLSREVEDRFQRYLDNVGEQVSSIQAESSRLKAENWRLSDDYRRCSQNRTAMIQQHKQHLDKLQLKHDEDKENLLTDKMKLNGEIEVLDNNVKYKNKEVEHLRQQLRQLNLTCMSKTGFMGLPGGSASRTVANQNGWTMTGTGGSSASSGSSGLGQFGRIGSGLSYGSSGSTFNKVGSTGTGASSTSLSSSGSSSATGYGLNKPLSTGTGSSSTSLSSSGSSSATGYGLHKPLSTGTGSSSTFLSSSGSSSATGYGLNKPLSTGTGSSSTSLSSSGASSATGFGFKKPGSGGTGSSSTSLSSSGASSAAGFGYKKPGSAGTGSSSTSLSSSGSSSSTGFGLNKPLSTGTGSSSTSLSSSGSGSATGSGYNKPGSTGGIFSGIGSTGSKPSLSPSGTGYNKPATSSRGSSSIGSTGSSSSETGSSKTAANTKSSSSSSSSSSGSTSKSSSGFSWLGFGSRSSGQSKTGSGTGKETSGGSTGTGSVLGGGRTSGLGGGSVSVAQHLQDLQRLINPVRPEERQDLSRILG